MQYFLSFSRFLIFDILLLLWLKAVTNRCSVKKVFLEVLQNSKENTCARSSFLIKLQALACNFIKKETLTQVFSCEFCEISKNTFSYRTPPLAACVWFTFRFLIVGCLLEGALKAVSKFSDGAFCENS